MLKSFRRSLSTTSMVMAPFLLTACGDDGGDKKKAALVIPLMMLFFTVFLVKDLSRIRASAMSRKLG